MDEGRPSHDKHQYRLRGESGEDFVNDLASRTFLIDWCYPNPKLPDGKELCDLLVIFEQTAIVWQIKTLKLRADGNLDARSAEKNLRQLQGARRQIFDLRAPIEITNARRHPEALDSQDIGEVFLISALVGDSPEVLGVPTETGGHPCHVLTRESVAILLNELDTISDFAAYLREKERMLANIGSIMLVGGERELLAQYILHARSFSDLDGHSAVYIEDGIWEGLQQRPEYQAKKQADRISYGWDSIIDTVHLGEHPEYERIARELARPNRFDRRYLSQSFYDAHLTAHRMAGPRMTFKRVSSFKATTFCFLFTDDGITRDERKEMLEALCFVARGTHLENRTVVGIGTEMEVRPTCSYDFCLMEIDEWTQQEELQKQAIQQATGLLTNIVEKELEAHEYPDP